MRLSAVLLGELETALSVWILLQMSNPILIFSIKYLFFLATPAAGQVFFSSLFQLLYLIYLGFVL